ncbi:MAG: helix-turn-helix transcriptional regulator [Verrucomicrobia bacterium]|nr:helix-turn-helix transcriptional regulator [Verrucomicrobiota bacterium]
MGAWSYRVKSWPDLARSAHYSSLNLANACGVSQRHLQRHFQQVYRLKLREWICELRLCDARHFLDGSRSIKQVAFLLGFKTSNHFNREFKRKFGVTPGKFAQSNPDINPQFHQVFPTLRTPYPQRNSDLGAFRY